MTSTYRIVISGSAWPSNFINAGNVTLERIISLAYVCLSWCGTMRVVIPAAAVTSWRWFEHYLKTVPVDRSSPPELLVKGPGIMRHLDWSSNGDLLFSDFSNGPPVIKVYSPADRRVVVFGSGSEGRFSPDGRWIEFVGFDGIFVQPFATRGGRIEISSTGAQPNWARDGGEIFYIAPDRKLMGVRFDAKKRWVGPPRVIFQTRIVAPAFFRDSVRYLRRRPVPYQLGSFELLLAIDAGHRMDSAAETMISILAIG